MGDNALHGPEVGTKCLSKSMVSHPQVKWDPGEKRDTYRAG